MTKSVFLFFLLLALAAMAFGQYGYPSEDWETPPYYWNIYNDGIAPGTTVPGYSGSHGWFVPVSTGYGYGDVIPDTTAGLWTGVQGRVNGVTPFTPVPSTDTPYSF